MKINEAMKKFRLPNPATPEDLEKAYRYVINFGDEILLAGHHYTGVGKFTFYGAIYEYLSDGRTYDSFIGLRAVSDAEFSDEGHALEWAMKH